MKRSYEQSMIKDDDVDSKSNQLSTQNDEHPKKKRKHSTVYKVMPLYKEDSNQKTAQLMNTIAKLRVQLDKLHNPTIMCDGCQDVEPEDSIPDWKPCCVESCRGSIFCNNCNYDSPEFPNYDKLICRQCYKKMSNNKPKKDDISFHKVLHNKEYLSDDESTFMSDEEQIV